MVRWRFLAPLAALCLSGASSTWVLLRLCRLRKRHQRKLLARQLWHLFLGDALFCLSAAVPFILPMALDAPEAKVGDIICSSLGFSYSAGLLTSVLVEAHMAVSFAAAMYRWSRSLWRLGRCLFCVWPLGALLAALEVVVVQIYWQSSNGCTRSRPDIVGFVLLAACFLLCLVCYIGSAVRARKAGEVVRWRVWNRANWYLVAALLTYGPDAKRILTEAGSVEAANGHGDASWFSTSAVTLLGLNGFLNAIIYALQTSYIRHARKHRKLSIGASRPTEAETRSSTPRSPRLSHQGAFHVAFQEDRVVVEVSPVQSESDDGEQRLAATPKASVAEELRGHEQPQAPEAPRRSQAPPPVVQYVGSAESDSELLLGCFDTPDMTFDDEEPDGFPAHVFVVGSPPSGASPLDAFARGEGRSPLDAFAHGQGRR